MHISRIVILWMHIILPVISLLLTQAGILALARAQQQKARMLSNFINLKSRAALAAARAKHPDLYNGKWNNRMGKFHAYNRQKRQVDSESGIKVIDETPNWFSQDINRVMNLLHHEEIKNANGASSNIVENQNQLLPDNAPADNQKFETTVVANLPEVTNPVPIDPHISVATNTETTDVQRQDVTFPLPLDAHQLHQDNPNIVENASQDTQNIEQATQSSQVNTDDSDNKEQIVSSKLDQQSEAMAQLQNMWNMNGFGNNQDNMPIVRTNEQEMLESPELQLIHHSPKTHSKAISIVKDKNTGATTFSYSSFDQWRNAQPNGEIALGQIKMEAREDDEDDSEPKKGPEQSLDFIRWLKEKEEEEKFNKAIKNLIDNPPKRFQENQTDANHGNQRQVEQSHQPEMVQEGNPDQRTADKILYKIYLKKVKLLEKKLHKKEKGDNYYPGSYYSTQSGYTGYSGNSGYQRSAEGEDSAEENSATMARLAEELEDENRHFPGHDPNHSGHVDGRCAAVDEKLFKIYKKKLEKLYKIINKKTDSYPVITPYYDNSQYDSGYGYNSYADGGGYNRNAKTQDEKPKTAANTNVNEKSAIENSTDPKVGAVFSNNNQQSPVFLSHPFVREAEANQPNEESVPENQLAREPLPHFKGGFTHSHTHFIKKDFGGPSLIPLSPAPLQINLNTNSFANSAASAGSFQQQQQSAAANSFASSGSQQLSFGNQQQSQAESFANAASNSAGSFQQQPAFINQQQSAVANSFANAGSQQSTFGNNQEAFTNSDTFQQQGGAQFPVLPVPVWKNRGEQVFGQANAQANQNNFQSGFSGQFGSQKSFAQTNAHSNANNFQQGIANGASAQASLNNFQQGGFASGAAAQSSAQAQAQASSFSQSPVTFGLGSNSQSFASASANAGAQNPWVRAESVIPQEEFMIDGESLVPNSKFLREIQNPTEDNEMNFVTNIVDQSLNLGEHQLNNEEINSKTSEDTMRSVTGIVDQSMKLKNIKESGEEPIQVHAENTELKERKKNVFDTMNFVTGIVDFGINKHETQRQRSSESASPLTRFLGDGLRIRRQAEFQINDMMGENQEMNFRNFQNQQEINQMMNQFQPAQSQNFFLNHNMQNRPQNPMFEQRSNFPMTLQDEPNLQMPQTVDNLDQTSNIDFEMQQLQKAHQEIIGAFDKVNNQAMTLQENFNNNNNQQDIPQLPQQILNVPEENKVQNADSFIPYQIENHLTDNQEESQHQGNTITTAFTQSGIEVENAENKQKTDASIPQQIKNQSTNNHKEFQQQTNFMASNISQNVMEEDDDEIITAPLPSHLKNQDDSSEEQSAEKITATTNTPTAENTPSTPKIIASTKNVPSIVFLTTSMPTTTTEIHPTPKTTPVKTKSESLVKSGTSVEPIKPNITAPKPSILDILHQAGVSEVFKSIDEELGMLTPEQKQEFIKQELELLTEMVVETLKKNGSAVMKGFAIPSTPKQGNFNITAPQSITSPDHVVSQPYLFQAPYDMTSSARESFYNRPEYSRTADNFDDTPLGMQNLEDHFDSILGMQHDAVQDLQEKAQNDGDLLMISWIGEGIVKDLENRRDKSNPRRKRQISALNSDPLSITKLVDNPTSRVDVSKTFDNLGAATRHLIENSKAPMYHVRSMIGNAKNSVMAAVKAAPSNFIVPSKYEITNVDDATNKVGSINKKLLKEKIIRAVENRKASGDQEDGSGIVDTFQKLGTILKDSVDSGKKSVAHANDFAMDARNVLYTARHSVPQIVTPLNHLPELKRSVANRLPIKTVLLAPRILEVAENTNLLGEEEPQRNENFVGLGNILDSVGLTNPDKNDIEIEKVVMQPETVEIFRQRNKGRPIKLRSRNAVKNWLKDSLKADQQTADDAIDNNLVGNSINDTIKTLHETEHAFGAKSLKDLIKKMRLQMKDAVKEHVDIISKQRRKLRKARILKKYKGIPVRKESDLSNLTNRHKETNEYEIRNNPNNMTQATPVPNLSSRIQDVTDIETHKNVKNTTPQNTLKEVGELIQVTDVPTTSSSITTTTQASTEPIRVSNDVSLITDSKELRSDVVKAMSVDEKTPSVAKDTANLHQNSEQLNRPKKLQTSTETPEDLNQKLGLYLSPDLMKPFMGRASNTQLNQFLRENNELEDIKSLKNIEKLTHQTTTSTQSIPMFSVVTSKTLESGRDHHQELDSQAVTPALGIMNIRIRDNNNLEYNEPMKNIENISQQTTTTTQIVPTISLVTSKTPELGPDRHQELDSQAVTPVLGAMDSKLRENNNLEDNEPVKNVEKISQQISTTTQIVPISIVPGKTLEPSHEGFDSQALTHVLGAMNPRMFEKYFNERYQGTAKGSDQLIDDHSQSILNDVTKHVELQNSNLKPHENKVDEDNFKPTLNNEDDHKFSQAPIINEAQTKTVLRFSENLDKTENSEEKNKARFNMIPSDQLYKKPFMGVMDKKSIKQFLKQYNHIEDSSSEEQTHFKKIILPGAGYEGNEVY